MELKGKTFSINKNDKKVVNTDETFAYFEDGACIKKDILVTKYEEVMNPTDFFNNTQSLNNIVQEVSKIDTDTVINSDNRTVVKAIEDNTETVYDNKQEEANNASVIQSQTPNSIVKIDNTGLESAKIKDNDFFSKIKRNNIIKLDFIVEEQFPDLEFVKMMNDNYETSIIDHFAAEIVEKMIYDPKELLEIVKNRIKEIVYKDDKPEPESTESTDSDKPESED